MATAVKFPCNMPWCIDNWENLLLGPYVAVILNIVDDDEEWNVLSIPQGLSGWHPVTWSVPSLTECAPIWQNLPIMVGRSRRKSEMIWFSHLFPCFWSCWLWICHLFLCTTPGRPCALKLKVACFLSLDTKNSRFCALQTTRSKEGKLL